MILNKLTEMYQGFGPTLASEKLLERDGIKVSKETVRQMTIAAVVHQPKKRRKDKAHPLRALRKRRGELVQIGGSYRAWLEERGEKACLLLFLAAIIMVGHLMDLESIRKEVDLVGGFYQRKFIVPEDPGFGTAMGVLQVLRQESN